MGSVFLVTGTFTISQEDKKSSYKKVIPIGFYNSSKIADKVQRFVSKMFFGCFEGHAAVTCMQTGRNRTFTHIVHSKLDRKELERLILQFTVLTQQHSLVQKSLPVIETEELYVLLDLGENEFIGIYKSLEDFKMACIICDDLEIQYNLELATLPRCQIPEFTHWIKQARCCDIQECFRLFQQSTQPTSLGHFQQSLLITYWACKKVNVQKTSSEVK